MQQSIPITTQRVKQSSQPKPKSRLWGYILAAFALFTLLIPMAGVAGTALYVRQTQMILPGVSVGPVDLSNLPLADAAIFIDDYWNNTTNLVVLNEQYKWTVTPPMTGLWIDPLQTAEQAYAVGRDTGGIEEIVKLATVQAFEVLPVVTFNEDVARDVFNDLAAKIVIPPTNATLAKDEQGHWYAEPGKAGLGLDVDATLAMIKADPQAILQAGYLQLPMQPLQPAIADLSADVERIAAFYETPIHLRAWDPITDELLTWAIPQDLVARWTKLDDPYGEPYIQVNQPEFEYYLAAWERSIGSREIDFKDPTDSLDDRWADGKPFTIYLRHKATEYTVGYGDNLISIGFEVGMPYWKIQEANPGVGIYGVHAGQVLTIPSKNEMLPYPPVLGKRVVISITEQRMWVYENFELKSEHVISTGMSDSPTLPGVFQIQTHEINAYASNWDLWMPHFMGIYEAVPGFMNGIHGLPVLSSGARLWANVLGQPASYGCIIMDLASGEALYNWAENGVVVEILP
jgi:lipoprotein-anchoring transpeptidase ErfK/SrfK